jgi:protein arginine kinase activator
MNQRKCDHCDNEATVHEVTVKSGVKIEKHLCESCAESQGIAPQSTTPMSELIKHYMVSHALAPVGPSPAARPQACPTCKTTFSEFRQHGLLGCPDCYKVFEGQLGPLLERAHDGGARHAGKLPRRVNGGTPPQPPKAERPLLTVEDRAERLRRIRKELNSAVQAEKYELAAKLRDELRRMSDAGPGADC